jgi:hypothetical protein
MSWLDRMLGDSLARYRAKKQGDTMHRGLQSLREWEDRRYADRAKNEVVLNTPPRPYIPSDLNSPESKAAIDEIKR